MSLELSRAPEGENPRNASRHTVKLRGWEFQVLVEAYEQLGGDRDTLAPLDTPALGTNDGVSQLCRAIARGEVTPDEIGEPIPAPEPEEGRFIRLEINLLPSELSEVRERVALGAEAESWRNRREDYKKLRQGVILPFVQEVSN